MEENKVSSSLLQEQQSALDLGKKVAAPRTYDPSVLRTLDRAEIRKENGLSEIPTFFGFDIWNCWEFTCLDTKGRPHQGILKLVIPANSPKLLESKSLKLYFASFAMTKFKDAREALATIKQDLSNAVQDAVQVTYFPLNHEESSSKHFKDYVSLEDYIADSDVECSVYTRCPELLKFDTTLLSPRFVKLRSDSLRSNCRVTHQPDYGTLYLEFSEKEKKEVDFNSLYQYIVSYRDENHFHEEIVEQVYMDLKEKYSFDSLCVFAKYTRRGGIDITPVRFDSPDAIIGNSALQDLLKRYSLYSKDIRQ